MGQHFKAMSDYLLVGWAEGIVMVQLPLRLNRKSR